MAAFRALFIDRFPVRSEVTLGVFGAAIEKIAAAGFLFHQLAFLALRAFHADEVLLDVLAFRIPAARSEFAEASVAQHHIAFALGALLVEGDIGNFLGLIQPPRGLAFGISGAGHELAEAAALEHHGAAAIFAIFLLRGFLQVGSIEVRQVDGIFLGEGAALRIIFLVSAAGVERTVAAPLDHQRRSATLALFFRRLFHALDVFHVLLRILQVFGELLVELGQRLRPLLFAFFDLIQFFFQPRGVGRVENIGKICHQQIGDHHADFSGHEFAAQLLHVFALLDGADDRRVSRRPADAAFFQLLH